MHKATSDMDACLEGKGSAASTHDASHINTPKDFCSVDNTNVKGIKTKERVQGLSARQKRGIEKRRKKQKVTQEDEPSLQNFNYGLPSFHSGQVFTFIIYLM